MNSSDTILMIIDVQGRLAQLMHQAAQMQQTLIKTIQIASLFDIPIIWTEQAPHKIGATIDPIASHLTHIKPFVKSTFSCCGQAEVLKKLAEENRHRIIVTGLETHVCVYQTVRDLLKRGYQVDVVDDAVSARHVYQHTVGIQRMQQLGAQITCAEMLFCELLYSADDPRFKQVMTIFKQ